MELLILIVVLALLSVPIMLIVTLAKLCGLENQISNLARQLVVIDLARSHKGTENITSRRDVEAQSGLELRAKPPVPKTDLRVSAPPRDNSPALVPQTPYEPTAFDMFWQRIEDWLAVRGDFAPKGMTHEFAFATR